MPIFNRYKRLQKYYLGVPVDPPEFQKGDLVTTAEFVDIERCENLYNWIVVENEYFCIRENDNTYTRYQKLQAHDKITNEPIDPPLFIAGELITDGCTEEECNGKPRYQEVFVISGSVDGIKYDQFERQISHDCGHTWEKDKDVYYYTGIDIIIDENFDGLSKGVTASAEVYFDGSISFLGSDNELYYLGVFNNMSEGKLVKINYDSRTVETVATFDKKKWNIYMMMGCDPYCYNCNSSTPSALGEANYYNAAQPYYDVENNTITYLYTRIAHEAGGEEIGIVTINLSTNSFDVTPFYINDGDIRNDNAQYYYNGYIYARIHTDRKTRYVKVNVKTKTMEDFTPSDGFIWYITSGSYTWDYNVNDSVIDIYNDHSRTKYAMENYQQSGDKEDFITFDTGGITFENADKMQPFRYAAAPQLRFDGVMQPFVAPYKEPPYETEYHHFHKLVVDGTTYIFDHSPYDNPINYDWQFMGQKGNIISYSYKNKILFVDLAELKQYPDVIYRTVEIENEFMCVGYNKYTKTKYQVNHGDGFVDTNPIVYRPGTLVEENSLDCGYRDWKEVEGKHICELNDSGKYDRHIKLQAYDNKGNPIEPAEYKSGDIVSYAFDTDVDCNNLDIDHRYSGEKICVGNNLYQHLEVGKKDENGQYVYDGTMVVGNLITDERHECVYPDGIALYEKATGKIISSDTVDDDAMTSKYTPIGIIVANEKDNIYGDNSIAIASLKWMDFTNPDNGSITPKDMYFGQYRNNDGILKTFNSESAVSASGMRGREDTKAMLDATTLEYKTTETVPNVTTNGSFTMACCTWRYHTEGTQQGDWFMPSLKELKYFAENIAGIKDRLEKLKLFGVDCMDVISTIESIITSTHYSTRYAWYYSVNFANNVISFNYNDKATKAPTIAYLRVGSDGKVINA